MEEQKNIAGMLELIPQPAFIVKDGSITLINQAARQHLIEPQTPIADLLCDDAQDYAHSQSSLHLTLNISGHPVDASVTRLDDYDVFQLKSVSSQAHLRTMALVSTEMRKPLSTVLNAADQLFPMLENMDAPDIHNKLAKINQGLNQLLRMAYNMSDAAQYAFDYAPHMSCRDICAVLEEIFERAQALASHRNVTFRYSVPREPILCMIDEDVLARAVYNMISNALKSAPDGGYIEATLTRQDHTLYLSVKDNGCGIPTHILGNISNLSNRQPGVDNGQCGLGLGMNLLYSAARIHGGGVYIDKAEGGGTRFTMTIAIRAKHDSTVRANPIKLDYTGGRDLALIQLSDALPPEPYSIKPE